MKPLHFAALTLVSLAAGAAAGPATPGGPLSSPYSPADSWDAYRMTAAFDLARGAGPISDWTGWSSGDVTGGSGHAYDDHSGTDFGMANGTPLYAVGNGTVTALRESVPNDDHSDTGNYIIYSVPASGRTFTVNNWHLSQNGVLPPSVGSAVTQGAQIAISDNTGNSTGPHLHFGVANASGTGNYACGFHNGWFSQDEFYYDATRPCLVFTEVTTAGSLNIREGASTSHSIVTSAPQGARFVASQRNTWWRIFLPSAPARALESRTPGGGVTAAPPYAETGAWTSSADKSAADDPPGSANRVPLAGAGSRFNAIGGTDTAQFVPNITQRGAHEVFATWPAQANARGVTCRVTHLGGTTDVVLDQVPGTPGGGSGTQADPYVIDRYPYVASHTTIGGPSVWNSYSPAGSGTPENGPERVYRFTVDDPTTVTIAVTQPASHPYPAYDVDVHLLGSLSNTNCLARNDFTISNYALPSAGTYYIAVDTYQNASRACPYTLTVTFGAGTEMANSWVSLGTYDFPLGQSAATGAVTILESTVTGAVSGSLPGRVYADAVRFAPVVRRSAWFSDGAGLSARINTASTPVCSVGIATDRNAGSDARDFSESVEVPIHAAPDANSAVVGKAITGQRFVCDQVNSGWYRVWLTNACDAPQGWISGQHLFIYNEGAAQSVPSGMVMFGQP